METSTSKAITLTRIRQKRSDILTLASKHGASHVRIFGSVACGETTTQSDVDFLVHFPPDRSLFELIDLWLELQDLLGCEVDLSTDSGLKPHVRPHALRDAVEL